VPCPFAGSCNRVAGSYPTAITCYRRFDSSRYQHSLLSKRELPQFVGFDSDPARRSRAETGFRDAITIASSVLEAPHFEDIYNNYFDSAGNRDDILQVFRNIIGGNTDGTGSSVIGNIFLDNEYAVTSCQCNEVAFTENINGKPGGGITLCDKAYEFPDLSDKSCDGLSSTVSTLMSTLGDVILHELTHYQEIGDPA
jgi:hypothetical protein